MQFKLDSSFGAAAAACMAVLRPNQWLNMMASMMPPAVLRKHPSFARLSAILCVWAWGLEATAQNWKISTTGYDINKVWMLNSTTGWAVGANGLILHTTNGGSSWTSQSSSTPENLWGVWGIDANNIWAVGKNGTICKYDGSSWAIQTSGTTGELKSVRGIDANNIWAVGEFGIILKYDGSTWASQPSDTFESLFGIWGSDANTIWAVGYGGIILKYNGSTWASQTSPTAELLIDVWGSDANNVWAVGDDGTILKSTNGGSTWASQTSPTTSTLNGVWGSDANNIWAVGQNGRIVKYNGSTWAIQTSGTTNTLNGVWGSDANTIWTVGTTGTIRKSSNGGSTWTSQASSTAQALRSVWGSGANDIWAVGGSGAILKYNGSTWASQTSGTTQILRGVWGSDANNIWAVGDGGTIRKYNGSTWASQTSGTTQILRGVWGSDANNIWAVGANGTILKYNGSTWESQTSPTASVLNAVWGSDANNIWAVSDGGTILKYNGSTWASQTSPTMNHLLSVWGSDANNIWVVGANGTILKSIDGGSSWASQTSGTSNTLWDVWGIDANNIWAVGNGNIRKSNGSTWAAEVADLSITNNAIWGVGTQGFIAANTGNVFTKTLSPSSTPTLTIGTATNPTNCTTPNGSIAFTSTGYAAGVQTLNYSKDGTPTSATVAVATNGTFSLTGLGAGAYTAFAIGATTATGTNPTLASPALPNAYNVTGTGSYCTGSTGVAVGLSNSETGVTYQLKNGTSNLSSINGTGSSITFGNQTAGTYTVVATRTSGGCTATMTGSAVVSLHTPVTKTWLGTTNSWNTASNWSPSGVPNECDNVIIPSSPQVPIISTTVSRVGTTTINQDRNLYIGAGGTLNNTGAITVNGLIDITTDVPGTPTLNNNSPGTITVNGDDANRGNGYILLLSRSPGAGILNNNSGATITFNNYAYLEVESGNTVTNAGTINNNSNCLLWIKGSLNGAGAINNSSGAITGNGGVISGSLYTNPASSTINLSYDEMGEHSCLSFNNSLTNNGNILFSIGGTTPCTEYDKITVTGTATLSGTFSAQLVDSYNPPLNTTFDVITATAISGTFTNNFVNLGNGKYANMYYTATKAQIKIESSAPNTCTTPTAYNVTGTGSYCTGGTGVAVGLDNSETGVTYQLKDAGNANVGTPVNGATGSAIPFGNQLAGTYTVVATRTIGGCTATMTGSAVVTTNPVPTITTNASPSICAGATSFTVPYTATTGTPTTYSISGTGITTVANGTFPASSPITVTLSPGASGSSISYTLTVRDANNCTSSSVMGSVTVTPAVGTPTFTAGATTLCVGGTSTYTAMATNSTSITYSILGGTGASIDPTTGAVSSVTGNFTVVATAAGTCGSNTTANRIVTVTPNVGTPNFSAGATTLCVGGTSTYTATATNSTSITYSILGGTGASIDPATGIVSAVTGNFTVIATAAGCNGPTTSNRMVTVKPVPAIPTLSGSTEICEGLGTTLLASSMFYPSYYPAGYPQFPITYQWTGGLTGSSIVASPLTTRTYRVAAVYDGCSSDSSAVFTLTVHPKPAIPTITANNMSMCKGGNVTLTGTCAVTTDQFRWTTPPFNTNGVASLPYISNRPITEPGTYKGLCESDKGCLSAEVSITITQAANCDAQSFITVLPEKPAICPGASLTLTAAGCSGTVTWTGGPTPQNGASVSVSPAATTTYTVDCSTGGSTTVKVIVATPSITITADVETGKEKVKAIQTIVSDKKVGVPTFTPGANVIYEAGNSITLLPGFTAEKWSVFKAEIKGCN